MSGVLEVKNDMTYVLYKPGFPQLHELDARLDVLGNVSRFGVCRVVPSGLARPIINYGQQLLDNLLSERRIIAYTK